MSTIQANLIEPSSGTTVTFGASGDTVTIPSGATIDASAGTATGFGGTPAFSAYSTGNQAVTGGVWTKASLQAEIIDTDSAFDSTTNYRFTVPSGEAGNYVLSGSISGYDSGSTLVSTSVKIYKNGSEITGSQTYFQLPASSVYMLAATTIVIALSAADYIELYGALTTTTGTLYFHNAGCILSGFKLGS